MRSYATVRRPCRNHDRLVAKPRMLINFIFDLFVFFDRESRADTHRADFTRSQAMERFEEVGQSDKTGDCIIFRL